MRFLAVNHPQFKSNVHLLVSVIAAGLAVDAIGVWLMTLLLGALLLIQSTITSFFRACSQFIGLTQLFSHSDDGV